MPGRQARMTTSTNIIRSTNHCRSAVLASGCASEAPLTTDISAGSTCSVATFSIAPSDAHSFRSSKLSRDCRSTPRRTAAFERAAVISRHVSIVRSTDRYCSLLSRMSPSAHTLSDRRIQSSSATSGR